MDEKELLQKADQAIADLLNTGGIMQPEQANTFYRKLLDSPTMLNEIRTVRMSRPKMVIPKINFGTRMLRRARNNFHEGSGAGRALTESERYKASFSKVEMDTNEFIAQINLPYEVLEDNIEGGNIDSTKFYNTILDMMGTRAARDMEEMVILSNTSSGDDFLNAANGILALATSNIVNQTGNVMSPTLFANMIKALPTQYHRLLNQFKFYCSIPREIDYRMQVATRQTSLGDAFLTGTAPVSVLGIPLRAAALMPNANMMLTIPTNIMLGIWRNIRVETERKPADREIHIIMTMRIGMQVEEEDMLVKAINIG